MRAHPAPLCSVVPKVPRQQPRQTTRTQYKQAILIPTPNLQTPMLPDRKAKVKHPLLMMAAPHHL